MREAYMLKEYLKERQQIVEASLNNLLIPSIPEYSPLYESMNYSLLIGGKRIRPILTMMVMEALGVKFASYMNLICAIELIHTYSLIHDDLPAMDNDDYRRGKLTNHVVYGEGMAILAGDGLLTEAFSIVASHADSTADEKVEIIKILSSAAGAAGMVGGQAFDLLSEGRKLTIEELIVLHGGKTGALFFAAVEIGLILGKADHVVREALRKYARALGLLFQITDDILDVVGTAEELGKTPGKDQKEEKATYVSILSLDEARIRAEETARVAEEALCGLPIYTDRLLELTEYLLRRSK